MHRETLRQLSAADLDGAAGGGAWVYQPITYLEKPKSNGWSSEPNAGCAA